MIVSRALLPSLQHVDIVQHVDTIQPVDAAIQHMDIVQHEDIVQHVDAISCDLSSVSGFFLGSVLSFSGQ